MQISMNMTDDKRFIIIGFESENRLSTSVVIDTDTAKKFFEAGMAAVQGNKIQMPPPNDLPPLRST